eukprot:m.115468 g.115468  ORF g.115468 m.115468 type:complete len:850 (-) comp15494_c0_seq2:526-3075(-)
MGKKRSAKQRQREAEVRKQAPKVAKVNRFELREQRQKHTVLGQKVKGKGGNRVQARDAAIKTREQTLLPEYRSRRKDGSFLDKRFGEYDTTMSVEDKMLARFAKEQRKKHSRSALFNLDDDDDEAEEVLLTHNDKPLTEAMDDYIGSDDEVDERAKGTSMSADMVAKYHFGGGDPDYEGDPNRKKSHKEIMAEVITKSKMHKRARQVQHEEAMELTDKLDAQMDDVMGLLLAESDRAIKEGRVLAAPADTGYDMAVVDLAEEAKAKATDRLKTPQEAAADEMERLQKLEQQRIDRMNGLPTGMDRDALAASTEYIGGKTKDSDTENPNVELRHKEDGTAEFVDTTTGQVVDMTAMTRSNDQDENDEDDASDDDEMDDLPAEQASDDELDDEEQGFGLEPAIKATRVVEESSDLTKDEDFELPFVYPAVESLQQLLQLLDEHSAAKRKTILTRLVACHSIHLGVEKREVQERHLILLLDYLSHLIQHGEEGDVASCMDATLEPIYTLAQQMPQFSATTCRDRVLDLFKRLKTSSWPSFPRLRLLYIFQLLPVLFPVSDRWHPVVTPSLLVLCNLLTHCNVGNLRNVAAGLYLCSNVHAYVFESQRYVPEAVAYLNSTCLMLLPQSEDLLQRQLLPSFKLLHQASPEALQLKPSKATKALNIAGLKLRSVETGFKGQKLGHVKLDLALMTLQLVLKFVLLYKHHQALPEMFSSALAVCRELARKQTQLPKALKKAAKAVIEAIGDPLRERPVARFQAHKPVPLAMLEPDYNEYGVIRKGSADQEVRETQRLKYELRKERKGAIRELRKDSRFLSKVRLQEVMDNDADRNKKLNAIHHLLQSEQALHKKTGK